VLITVVPTPVPIKVIMVTGQSDRGVRRCSNLFAYEELLLFAGGKAVCRMGDRYRYLGAKGGVDQRTRTLSLAFPVLRSRLIS
jgi:hypothetical protein